MAASVPASTCRARALSTAAPDECPACAGVGIRYAFGKDGYDLARCGACGFLFVHPYPSEATLAAYYAALYRDVGADFYPKARSRRLHPFAGRSSRAPMK